MQGYQSVTIAGNLGRDPEIRYVNDKPVCNFSIACNEKWDGGEHTEWFNVAVWGKPAEACSQYLNKGDAALVTGTLRTREYEKDGEKRRATDLRAQRVVFLSTEKRGNGGGSSGESQPKPDADANPWN